MRDTRLFTRVFASTPNRLMLTSWGAILAPYWFGPVTYHHVPTLSTWIFIALCTFAFVSGGWLSRVMRASKIVAADHGQPDPPDRRIARVAAMGAWLGMIGIAAIA